MENELGRINCRIDNWGINSKYLGKDFQTNYWGIDWRYQFENQRNERGYTRICPGRDGI